MIGIMSELWGGCYTGDRNTLQKFMWFRTTPGGQVPRYKTVAGEIVQFLTRRVAPLKIEANFTPIQDLHGQEAPWPPGGGVNKCPLPTAETKNGVTLAHNADGSVTITGTASAITYFDFFDGDFDSTAFVGLKFTTGFASTGRGVTFRISASDRVSIQNCNTDMTIADNGSGLYFAIRVANGAELPTGGVTIYPMIAQDGATFAPYSNECPISGHTGCDIFVKAEYDPQATPIVAISFGQTVYGGTLTVNEDGSGQIVADMVKQSNLWSELTLKETLVNTVRKEMTLAVTGDGTIAARNQSLSNVAKFVDGTLDYVHYQIGNTGLRCYFYLPPDTPSDTVIELCYILATPVTIPLTPGQVNALQGNNTVWVDDSGDISVTYRSN